MTDEDMDEKILALQSLLSCDTVGSEVTNAVLDVIRREKENKVLKVHKYKISGPIVTKKQVIWSTRCPWLSYPKINRSSYEDVIDFLYEHYFGDDNDNITVQEVFEKMMAEYEQNNVLAYLSIVHYKADWKKHIVEKGCEWLDKPIKNVKPSQVFDHYRKITANCVMKRSTFNNVKTVVNAVFDYAIIHDIPCIKARSVDTKRLRFAPEKDKWEGVYSLVDRQKILNTCEKEKPTVYTKAIELMFCLDIRIGELRALYKEDVDLDKKTIYIGHQMVDVKTDKVNRYSERTDIMKGKTEAGKRTQPLSKRAVSVIEWLFEHYPNSDWLLPSNTLKTPIRTHRFNDNLKRICEKAGVKYFSSHGIRFHNISAMYDAGISEKEIQRMSGHTTSAMTRHYNKRLSGACEDEKIRAVLG